MTKIAPGEGEREGEGEGESMRTLPMLLAVLFSTLQCDLSYLRVISPLVQRGWPSLGWGDLGYQEFTGGLGRDGGNPMRTRGKSLALCSLSRRHTGGKKAAIGAGRTPAGRPVGPGKPVGS